MRVKFIHSSCFYFQSSETKYSFSLYWVFHFWSLIPFLVLQCFCPGPHLSIFSEIFVFFGSFSFLPSLPRTTGIHPSCLTQVQCPGVLSWRCRSAGTACDGAVTDPPTLGPYGHVPLTASLLSRSETFLVAQKCSPGCSTHASGFVRLTHSDGGRLLKLALLKTVRSTNQWLAEVIAFSLRESEYTRNFNGLWWSFFNCIFGVILWFLFTVLLFVWETAKQSKQETETRKRERDNHLFSDHSQLPATVGSWARAKARSQLLSQGSMEAAVSALLSRGRVVGNP